MCVYTHTDTHVYIYIYFCLSACAMHTQWPQVNMLSTKNLKCSITCSHKQPISQSHGSKSMHSGG